MSPKVIGGGLATLIICSHLDLDESLAWANQHCPTPGKKLQWNPDIHASDTCNCKPSKPNIVRKHYLFTIFT